MSDDLIERLELWGRVFRELPSIPPHPDTAPGMTTGRMILDASQAAARIRELESANYRLTEERDRLKSWADRYHDEVLELRALKPKASE